ncbi:MAG: BACON domain-containing protein [Bacteroidales bacterium]|nr:BACON domain-containing protein [Bacteroidales bacterium]
MKLRNLFVGAIASAFALAACQEKEQNLGVPDLSISVSEMTFEEAGGEQTLTVNATRDWKVQTDADWVVVDPASGEASADDQTVTVSVLENTGMDRTADIKFTIGMKSKYLTVSQAGPGGSTEALIVYYNDYDKVEAEKTYGSGSSWPYLDQFDGWMNQTGTGAANVEYAYNGMSARANSTSDSNYSDYPGSGKNNMFFGKSAYLATKNIALGGATDFTLTFGSEKYSQDGDSVFKNAEFHVYLSNDAAKWVEIDYTFAGTEGGRWNIAAADFSVPAGTENLSVCVKADVASVYRMDDLKLVISEGGAEIDFSKGVEMDFTAGGSTGGSTTAPESKGKKTVEEFIAAADTQNYYELTGTVSGFNPTYCSFDLTDATGKIYVYSVLDASKAEWTSKISNGGTITIYGQYLYYEQKSQHEVVNAYIVSFEGDGSGSVDSGKPETLIKATVAEFLAAEESSSVWYELTGEIISIAKQDYGNFTIKDATGEIYIYGMTSKWVGSNDKSFSQIGLKVGDTVTLGTLRGSYNGQPQGGGNPVPAFYISHVPGEGGEVVTPPAGETGEYEPQGVTWTLGEKAYDNTSGSNAQKGTVNGVSVANMLKLGTGSLTGDAVLHVAEGTTKLGFYCVAWKGKTAQVKFSVDGTEVTTITPAANTGATGNPPYASITVTESDYFEVELPSGATDIKVETLDPANGRVIFIGLKAITE